MAIVSKTILNEFSRKHSAASEPLNYWYEIVKKTNWSNPNDILLDFNNVDVVGND